MRSVFFRCYNDSESCSNSVNTKIRKPDLRNTANLKHGPYDKLDDDGLIRPGT
jgi:DNA-directed RNA polymerase II subunit RPB2